MNVCELFDVRRRRDVLLRRARSGRSGPRRAAPARLRAVPAAARGSARDPPRARVAPGRRRAAGRRLVRLHAPARSGRRARPPNRRTSEPSNRANRRTVEPSEPWNLRTVFALAAMLALVTHRRAHGDARSGPPTEHGAVAVKHRVPRRCRHRAEAARRTPDRALREGSVEHLERSKLVVLGLATRDPRARARDWQYERDARRHAADRHAAVPAGGHPGRRRRRRARHARSGNGAARSIDERQDRPRRAGARAAADCEAGSGGQDAGHGRAAAGN